MNHNFKRTRLDALKTVGLIDRRGSLERLLPTSQLHLFNSLNPTASIRGGDFDVFRWRGPGEYMLISHPLHVSCPQQGNATLSQLIEAAIKQHSTTPFISGLALLALEC